MAKKAIKKRWVKIIATKDFNEAQIGETYVTDPKACVGKKVTCSLGVLGIDTRQNINVTFQISNMMGDKLVANLVGYRIMPSSVKRMSRRLREKLDDSFIVLTKDGVKVRVKPILVTRFKTTSSVKKALRASARNKIALMFESVKYIDIMKDIIGHRVQKKLFDGLKKTFPLSVCEIRWLIRLEDKKSPVDAKPELKVATEEPKTTVAQV